jgi:sensor histidine kinase YesM
MILQPLVENSYIHGIRNLERQGRINITLYKDEGYICVDIADNGVGMSQKDIDKLTRGEKLRPYDESTMSTGIGVCNVLNRLQIYYGRERVMKFESKQGEGTTVTLYLEETM